MFIYNDSQFADIKIEVSGDELEACDNEVVIGGGGDLAPILWLMRCQAIPPDSGTGHIHRWVKGLLPAGFFLETSDLRSSSTETLCVADVEVGSFLNCLGLSWSTWRSKHYTRIFSMATTYNFGASMSLIFRGWIYFELTFDDKFCVGYLSVVHVPNFRWDAWALKVPNCWCH